MSAAINLSNDYISQLNRLILQQMDTITTLQNALERCNIEKTEVLCKVAEKEVEVWLLKEQLRKRDAAAAAAEKVPEVNGVEDPEVNGVEDGAEECSIDAESVEMVRQRGYMGHADRPMSE